MIQLNDYQQDKLCIIDTSPITSRLILGNNPWRIVTNVYVPIPILTGFSSL